MRISALLFLLKKWTEKLICALDHAIDDVESGRVYTVEEGMKKVREIRMRRKNLWCEGSNYQ